MMNLRFVFYPAASTRLRAGWRIAGTLIILMVLAMFFQFAAKPVMSTSWTKSDRMDVLLIFLAIATTMVLWFSSKRIDRRPFSDYGIDWNRRALLDIFLGILISATSVGLIVGIEVAGGWLIFESNPVAPTTVLGAIRLLVVSGFCVAWWENLFFVSFLFLNLREGLGNKWA